MYEVRFSKCARKSIRDLPEVDRKKLNRLVDALRIGGPVLPSFRNFSKLGKDTYHCHLSYS